MKSPNLALGLGMAALVVGISTTGANAPAWLEQPLSLVESLDLALQNNSRILKAESDLEAAYGLVVQTRAIAIPKVRASGFYEKTDPGAVETIPPIRGEFPMIFPDIRGDQRWAADIRVVQSVYEGGRIASALRTARLTKERALLEYQTVVADVLLETQIAYHDVLLGEQLVLVQEASVRLLAGELEDQRRRFEAGTVPRFNLLRAEVEVANARPRLIRARNNFRIAKNTLANVLGFDLPRDVWEDIPLRLSGRLEAEALEIELPVAVGQALENRTELAALRTAVGLAREAVVTARGARRPSVQVFAGYGSRNSLFSDDLTRDLSGYFAGAQVNWDIFDGLLNQGRVDQAKAQQRRAELDIDDTARRIELEVRTAYSLFVEAREMIDSQRKVQEQAEEALRLAQVRGEAGTGTQLDVLNAQTALTEARTTQVQALRDYAVARARLERAMGQNISRRK
jgi:outer membrane protein